MARWAVFDVDGTLIPGVSMEQIFLGYLMKKKLLPAKNIAWFFLYGIVSIITKGIEEGPKKNKSYLRKMPVEAIEKFAEDCFRKHIENAVSRKGINELNSRRDDGYKIMIMSGSPEFLARRLGDILRPDFIASTNFETSGGKFTGGISGIHPYGRRKLELLNSLKDKLDIDFQNSIVYANHDSDIFHMEQFGQAVAVNAASKLRQEASKRNWRIEKWDL